MSHWSEVVVWDLKASPTWVMLTHSTNKANYDSHSGFIGIWFRSRIRLLFLIQVVLFYSWRNRTVSAALLKLASMSQSV